VRHPGGGANRLRGELSSGKRSANPCGREMVPGVEGKRNEISVGKRLTEVIDETSESINARTKLPWPEDELRCP
jgi:hypothetical protein